MELNGVAALVSGGASGLGEATVRELTAAGATVVIADVNTERGEALAKEVGGVFVRTDVADEDQVQAAVQAAVDTGKPLRAAVSCAGIAWAARTVARDGTPHDLASFRKIIDVNLIGTFNVVRLAAAAMAKTEPINDDGERGAIVNTASVAGIEGQIGQIAYSSSKGGIIGMTVPAARDLAAVGVRVNTIAPGILDTPIYGQGPEAEEFKQRLAAPVPFPKRLGTPAEFAQLVRALLEISYINAEVVRIDGGLRMQPK
ncbi:SDR family oxidoreductase [Thermobifida fusca]|jgi:NAD(P)-dependent dehydrogenase (short-subunit alcohol dehydrogenase family)|uniref:Short chain dehydrogenase n=2 Tax=Thermobifida fusca TaxID=2021 RepID=A0A9P2TD75_THEFU|nr:MULTISPECIES: SDR family oxidoreductase [Thermobifida]AAZ54313.1 putative short chain dehydrogenase [Thermobifida fusca YX]EOR72533.1 short chain dehydrogenase [Thermobifida fusca TM51]MBO2529824.1 3-hydroxyacyl-CoA dehydrogenase [Thermobifida sp.]MDD6792102.1 SDR family oxidoreductase [Thermobifida fusca]PPS94064.1 3-hydroxy-2-methylbutyryl-CoA dehydrogenase [Thermobifida fusca]